MEKDIYKIARDACAGNVSCVSQSNEAWCRYTQEKGEFYRELMPKEAEACILSEANWLFRRGCNGSYEFNIYVHPGDICWLDYGRAYNREMGFQHFGLILTICAGKALIAPITSSASSYERTYGDSGNYDNVKYQMSIGIPKGLRRYCTVYLNDLRFINTARIIGKRGYIPVNSPLFIEIKRRVKEILGETEEERWSC